MYNTTNTYKLSTTVLEIPISLIIHLWIYCADSKIVNWGAILNSNTEFNLSTVSGEEKKKSVGQWSFYQFYLISIQFIKIKSCLLCWNFCLYGISSTFLIFT